MRRLLFVLLALVGAVVMSQPAHADHRIDFDQGFKVKNRCGERFFLKIVKKDGKHRSKTLPDGDSKTLMFNNNHYTAHNAGGTSTFFFRKYTFVPSRKQGDDVASQNTCVVEVKYTTNDNLTKVVKHEKNGTSGKCSPYTFSNESGKTMTVTVNNVPY